MRTLLLWMARNGWLRARVPQLAFAKRAVRRFMPGEDLDAALDAATGLVAAGQGIVLTRLGENLNELSEADAVAAHYHEVLDASVARGVVPQISVKLTQIGLDIDRDACFRHALSLAEHAERVGSCLFMDMEDSSYVDATLAVYEAVLAEHPRTGICLQAYLRRTVMDATRLLPLGPSIRLVKGAYDEPKGIAFRTRAEVDGSYQALSLMIGAAAAKDDRVRLMLGTHDSALVERIAAFAAATGIPRSAFEVVMLYGIRAKEAARLAAAGYRVSTLIAYGEFWYPWYMRRLAERPANVLFALRQLLP